MTELAFRFDPARNFFSLLRSDYAGGGVTYNDETYNFLLYLVYSHQTGELIGFTNDSSDLAQDYERLMELLAEHPIPGCYDVPDLGLTGATLPEVITAIYERYVARREPEFAYPTAGGHAPALQVADRDGE
ncbi:MAG: hypothetical protein V3S14_14985 [Anaerolineae bacterium]